MLYSAVLELKPLDAATTAVPNGYQVYGLLMALLRSANPELARRLHEGEGAKPLTTSLRRQWRSRPVQGSDTDRGVSLRFTFLDDEPLASLIASVVKLGPGEVLYLGEGRFQCVQLATTPAQSPWARYTSFSELLDTAPEERVVRLSFTTPTTFRSGGRRSALFPEPSLVFGSLLARWNAFSDVKLDAERVSREFVRVQPIHYRLQTAAISFGSYEELGFIGSCTYKADVSVSSDVVRALQALAGLAFYSGVGAKTTMGMGQCRRVERAGALPHRAGGDPPQRKPVSATFKERVRN